MHKIKIMEGLEMIKRKVISAITALIMSFSAVSASIVSANQEIAVEYEGYDTKQLDAIISDFRAAYSVPENDAAVRENVVKLLEQMSIVDSQSTIAYIAYCKDATNENALEYNTMSNMYATVSGNIYNEFVSAANSGYVSVIKEYLGEDIFTGYNQELMEYEQKFLADELEIQNKYNLVVQSSLSESEKNLKAAELYMELVKLANEYISVITDGECKNYIEYAYAAYSRDYSPQDIIAISTEAKEYLKQYHKDVTDMFHAVKQSNTSSFTHDDNFEIISRYVGEISPELADSINWLRENELYSVGEGSGSLAMSYTSLLSQYKTPYIYQYEYNAVNDLFTSVHEFGHFNAARYCFPDSWIDIDGTNIDIAEVHSQGLEALFTNYYDEIFGTSSDACTFAQLSDMISAVSAGFMVNEFEHYVFSNYNEEMTAEDVVNKYNELKNDYEIYPIEMYKISHIFQTPGYYISYAVSALAALEIWGVMQYDYDRAVQMYTDFSHCSYLDYDYTFMASLEECGFSNVLGEGYISTTLAGYVEKIISQNVMGDVDNNGVVTALDLKVLISALVGSYGEFDEEQVKLYDLNGSGTVDVSDALKLKMSLVDN